MDSKLMGIFDRIYADYLMPSRLGEYERLLKSASENGYRHLTLHEYFNEVILGKEIGKCFINRHDIDTDVRTARKMFEIERNLGVKTSFYFRLNTLDYDLMKEIHSYGSEVGYHYEELAQYCKDYRITSPVEIKKYFTEIQAIFKINFLRIQKECEFNINTIASHGDFVNRKLAIPNHNFITQSLLDELKIAFECYDPRLFNGMNSILSDTHYPDYYRPSNPFKAIEDGHKVIYLLTHPRHWRTAPLENTSDNIKRLWEGFRFK